MIDIRSLVRGVALQGLYEIDVACRDSLSTFSFIDSSALVEPDVRTLAYLALRAFHENGEDAFYEDDLVSDDLTSDSLLDPAQQEAARCLIKGVLENQQRLDAILQRYSSDMPLDQVPAIDRNILRLVLYEFAIGGKIPLPVAINEAVVLAKIFGGDTSPSFINGVLGTLSEHHWQVRAELRKDTQGL